MPYVDLGADTLAVDFPFILEPEVSEDVTGYLWSTDSQESSIIVDQTGTYWLAVSNNYGCIDSDTIYIHDGTWIIEIPEIETFVMVYPNPVKDFINVDIQSNSLGKLIIEVFSSKGQRYFYSSREFDQQAKINLNVEDFPQGIYMLRININGIVKTVKVLVL